MGKTATDVGFRIRVLAAAFVLTLAVGWWHMPKCDPQEVFHIHKYETSQKFDILLLGDSRVFVGLDPTTFEAAMPGSKCFNFGFSSLGFNDGYFRRVNEILFKDSRRRVIVIGVDGPELTDLCAENSGFMDIESMTPLERFHFRHLAPLWLGPDTILRGHKYLSNGWVPLSKLPYEPQLSIDIYSKEFSESRCTEQILVKLCDQIRQWRSEGITVLATRMPTSTAMFQLECNLIGYRPQHVEDALSQAGAYWIELPNSDAEAVDGSHLAKDTALRVSALVAGKAARLSSQ